MFEVLRKAANSNWFGRATMGLILLSALIIGLETRPDVMAEFGHVLKFADKILLFLFTLEVLIRLGSTAPNYQNYFKDGWNIFDFAIVAICYMPIQSEYAVVLRLVRILRALRLVRALPKLRMIVEALIKSISSMGYVGLLLSIVFYIYGVLGVFMFGAKDPEHFGSLSTAFLTIFQIMTLEGWVDLMKPLIEIQPLGAPLYFISFIFLGTMITLNLFIGIIISGMTEIEKKEQEEKYDKNELHLLEEIRNLKDHLTKIENQIKERN